MEVCEACFVPVPAIRLILLLGGTEGKSRGELSCPNDVRSGKQQGR